MTDLTASNRPPIEHFVSTEPFDPKTAEGVPNLLMSPHTAFYSDAAIKESQTKAATQVINVLTGKAPEYDVR